MKSLIRVKTLLLLLVLMPVMVFAQEAAEAVAEVAVAAPVAGEFPWKENALVVLVVTTTLGILSSLVNKIPGEFGKILQWLIDMFSANVKHK